MENTVKLNTKGKFGDILSNNDWKEIIKNKLNTTDFKILERSVKSFSDRQLGIMGEHLSLQATVAVSNGKDSDVSQHLNLNFFAKSIPRGIKAFENFVESTQSFLKEYRFYLDILPDLKKHQIQEEASWSCKCYLAKPDILVFENLMCQGFQHYECKPSIDYKHCALLAETLARFHAESVIFEEKESCTIADKYSDILFETFWVTTEGHPGNDFLHSSAKKNKKTYYIN